MTTTFLRGEGVGEGIQCTTIHYVSKYWNGNILCWYFFMLIYLNFCMGGVKVKSCIGIWREKGGGKRPYVSLGIMRERGRGLDHPQKKFCNLWTVPYTCSYPLRKWTLCTGEFIVAKGKNTNVRSLLLPTV